MRQKISILPTQFILWEPMLFPLNINRANQYKKTQLFIGSAKRILIFFK